MGVRDEARERTRARVLDSAAHRFRQDGFDAATIRGIADDAGVSVGSVLAVGDKQSLLVEVFDRGIAELHRQAPGARGSAAGPASSSAEALLAIVKPFLGLFTADPALARRYAAILVAGAHRSEVFDSLARRLTDEFGDRFEAAGRAPAEARARARAAYYSYLGVLFSAAGAGDRTSPDLAALEGRLRDVFASFDREEDRRGAAS
ncbi:TetR/AcrR family transcriptional regulator [Leucobacter weissii]|uniref:TetR/AcrR family transcriptional regulator n=1 Tax=Leucobacter weissii TaxID=1983706 RepID=A0A939MKF4_9MICO|nr:TetR/AcrR family transcriptional regulator [Leucobacter weissii]MBO1901880.1 TetR/AcrR family transcriptional regulator [Leucobacter weissii]